MPAPVMPSRSLTQQRAAKKDRNAITRAEKHGISDGDIIQQLASTHTKPYSAEAYAASAGIVLHTRCNMSKESPIHDAVSAIVIARATANSGQPA